MLAAIDPILMRGLERIFIVMGAVAFGYFGYRLFIFGASRGKGEMEFSSALAKVVFSGTGPGLFFMAFGSVVLVTALMTGGASVEGDRVMILSSRLERLERQTTLTDFGRVPPSVLDFERVGFGRWQCRGRAEFAQQFRESPVVLAAGYFRSIPDFRDTRSNTVASVSIDRIDRFGFSFSCELQSQPGTNNFEIEWIAHGR